MKNCSIETIELPTNLRDFVRQLPEMLAAGNDNAQRSAFVSLPQTIAKGASCCRIVVYLRATPESDKVSGTEY
jgi:hypothetical protein